MVQKIKVVKYYFNYLLIYKSLNREKYELLFYIDLEI